MCIPSSPALSRAQARLPALRTVLLASSHFSTAVASVFWPRRFSSCFQDTWKWASPNGQDKRPCPASSRILWLCIRSHNNHSREVIWTSATDAANPASPWVILWSDIQIWVVSLDTEMITRWRKYTSCFPPHTAVVLSKNSPKQLKMCLNLLTGKWMMSRDWEGTRLLSGEP